MPRPFVNCRTVAFTLAALAFAGCNRRDTESLARIGKKTLAHGEAMTADVKRSLSDNWQQARGTWGVAERVANRLRWDKSLADAVLQVTVKGDALELKGSVKTVDQRRRALELADSTTGVEKVVDQIAVEGTP